MAASATGNYIQDKGYDAAVAITLGKAVKFSADETVTPVTAKTDIIAGVAVLDVSTAEIALGKGAVVRTEGDAVMLVSAAVSAGQVAGLNADGTVHSAASGDRVIGEIMSAASGAGKYCRVHLTLAGALAP